MEMEEKQNASMELIRHINDVPNFDPDVLCQILKDNEGTVVGSHLPVRAQKGWFRLKNPEGKITLDPVKIDYEAKFAVFRARVYAHKTDAAEAFVSEAYATRAYDPNKPDVSYIEWAQTAAVGRALTDAGYGLQYDHSGDVPDYLIKKITGSSNQQQTPGQQPSQGRQPSQNQPGRSNQNAANAPQNTQPTPKRSAQQPQGQPSQPSQSAPDQQSASDQQTTGKPAVGLRPADPNLPANKQPAVPNLSYEQALAVVVPFGENSGKTLQQVAQAAPDDLEWLATKYGGSNNSLLKQAATLIWQRAQAA